MHAVALQLAPVLGAEKSKVPFYIAGGLLVLWALLVSLGLGLRRPDFPGSPGAERGVIAITALLVLGAVSTAVITSGTAATGTTSAAAASPTAPRATTGTPAPASSPAAVSGLKLAADPGGQLSYDTKQLSGRAGTVTITMANMAPLEHNVTIAQGSKVLGATPTFAGGSRTVTVKLKPGKYTFYCSVPGHRQGGMEGTLSVS